MNQPPAGPSKWAYQCQAPGCSEPATRACDPCGREFCTDHTSGPFIAYGIETTACDACRHEDWE